MLGINLLLKPAEVVRRANPPNPPGLAHVVMFFTNIRHHPRRLVVAPHTTILRGWWSPFGHH